MAVPTDERAAAELAWQALWQPLLDPVVRWLEAWRDPGLQVRYLVGLSALERRLAADRDARPAPAPPRARESRRRSQGRR